MNFAADIIDIGVCPGFWKTRKMEKCILPVWSLLSPHISYATLSQNALGLYGDTVSNGFSSEVISIFCNHRNKKLKQLSLPNNSKLNCHSLISGALLLCRGRRQVTVLPLTYSIKTCNALEAGTWPRTKNQIIIRAVTVKAVRKGGVGVTPSP